MSHPDKDDWGEASDDHNPDEMEGTGSSVAPKAAAAVGPRDRSRSRRQGGSFPTPGWSKGKGAVEVPVVPKSSASVPSKSAYPTALPGPKALAPSFTQAVTPWYQEDPRKKGASIGSGWGSWEASPSVVPMSDKGGGKDSQALANVHFDPPFGQAMWNNVPHILNDRTQAWEAHPEAKGKGNPQQLQEVQRVDTSTQGFVGEIKRIQAEHTELGLQRQMRAHQRSKEDGEWDFVDQQNKDISLKMRDQRAARDALLAERAREDERFQAREAELKAQRQELHTRFQHRMAPLGVGPAAKMPRTTGSPGMDFPVRCSDQVRIVFGTHGVQYSIGNSNQRSTGYDFWPVDAIGARNMPYRLFTVGSKFEDEMRLKCSFLNNAENFDITLNCEDLEHPEGEDTTRVGWKEPNISIYQRDPTYKRYGDAIVDRLKSSVLYRVVLFRCTSGRHRSVAICTMVQQRLARLGFKAIAFHLSCDTKRHERHIIQMNSEEPENPQLVFVSTDCNVHEAMDKKYL